MDEGKCCGVLCACSGDECGKTNYCRNPSVSVNVIRVCRGSTCGAHYSQSIMHKLEQHHGLKAGSGNQETDLDYRDCTGYCSLANNVEVNGNIISRVMPEDAVARIEETKKLPPRNGQISNHIDIEKIISELVI